jgi:hypothetical protein
MELASRGVDRPEVTMFRVLSILFLALGLIVVAVDLYSSLTVDGTPRLAALGEWWARIDRDSLLILQPAVERHISPVLWDPGIQTVLEWPLAVELAVLSAICWLLRRRKRQQRHDNLKSLR